MKYKIRNKFLGLHVTECIIWDVHIKNESSKLLISCNIMQVIKSVNILSGRYFANFNLHLRYGILFWGGDGEIIQKIYITQENYQINQQCRKILLAGCCLRHQIYSHYHVSI
jgi:hypothetical protein